MVSLKTQMNPTQFNYVYSDDICHQASSGCQQIKMKAKTITIRVHQDLYQKFFDMAESEAVTLSELARKAVDDICHQTSSERHQTSSELNYQEEIKWFKSQLENRDEQIERLQKALDQEQQLHAISQNTIEAQRLQIEEKTRPFWRRLLGFSQ